MRIRSRRRWWPDRPGVDCSHPPSLQPCQAAVRPSSFNRTSRTTSAGSPFVSDLGGIGSLGIYPAEFAWYKPFGVDPLDANFLIVPDFVSNTVRVTHADRLGKLGGDHELRALVKAGNRIKGLYLDGTILKGVILAQRDVREAQLPRKAALGPYIRVEVRQEENPNGEGNALVVLLRGSGFDPKLPCPHRSTALPCGSGCSRVSTRTAALPCPAARGQPRRPHHRRRAAGRAGHPARRRHLHHSLAGQ